MMSEETNGRYVVTSKDLHSTAIRYMGMACNTFNYETQQGPAFVYALFPVLRKIYKDDDDYVTALNNHFKYFNTTTWMANIILGAVVAMEEKDGIDAVETIQSFKTSLMGPLAGIGDTLIWVLLPTIMGSISGYMALQGNPTGAIMWLILNIAFLFVRIKLFDVGYKSGLKLITSFGDKLNILTEAASILGLAVVGSLIPSVIKMNVAYVYKVGQVSLSIQKDVLDKIMPALLPAVLTIIVYKMLDWKKMTTTRIIIIVIVFSMLCSLLHILSA